MSQSSVSLTSHLNNSNNNRHNVHSNNSQYTNNTYNDDDSYSNLDSFDDCNAHITYNDPTYDLKQLIYLRYIHNIDFDIQHNQQPFVLQCNKSTSLERTNYIDNNIAVSKRLYILKCNITYANLHLQYAKKLVTQQNNSYNKSIVWNTYSNNNCELHIKLHHPSLLGMIQLHNKSTSSIEIYGSLNNNHTHKYQYITTQSKLPHNKISYIHCGYIPVQYIKIKLLRGSPVSLHSISIIGIQLHNNIFDNDDAMQHICATNPAFLMLTNT